MDGLYGRINREATAPIPSQALTRADPPGEGEFSNHREGWCGQEDSNLHGVTR